MRPRAKRLARRRDPHGRDHRARFRARGARVVASALHRLRGVRGAEGRSGRARARVPQHGAADRDALPRRRERLPHDVARAERRRARAGVGADGRRVHAERRPRPRRSLDGVVVARRRGPRVEGAASPRPARPRRVHRQRPRERARLADGDVRGRACTRPARAVGSPHGPRPGRGVVGIHGAGRRRRDRARRDARAARRRRSARRGARAARPRSGRHGRDRAVRRTRTRLGRPRDGRAHRERRGDRSRAGRTRERDAEAAVRRPPRRGRTGGSAVPFRSRGDADPLRAVGAAALARRRTARTHGDRSPDARPRRSLARGERSRARAAPGRGDRRRRPAAGGRSLAGARRPLDPLDPAAGGAVAAEGRRRRRARYRRRHVDGGAARALRRPDPGADRRARAQLRVVDPPSRHALARGRRGGQSEHARRGHLLRLVRARPEPPVAAAARAPRPPHRRRRPLAHPGPGLGAGSGTLVAKELLRPTLAVRMAAVAKSIRSAT